jgi:hypothetical protein
LTAVARNEAGDWSLVVTPDGYAAWVFNDLIALVNSDDSLESLPEAAPGELFIPAEVTLPELPAPDAAETVDTPETDSTTATAVPADSGGETGADGDCVVSNASRAVNQRSGPGTGFDVAGSLEAGVSESADGQASGADGFVWWRLASGGWVRNDVVDESGNCDSLPVVQ